MEKWFVENQLAKSYIPEENLAVDEQLFPSKARCHFTQYTWQVSRIHAMGFLTLGRRTSTP
jgi:hypothetical protein